VTDQRAFLLDALRRVRDGGTFTNEELLSVTPDPSSLEEIERSAWYRLSHWADDDDIRAKDSRYADMQKRHIREALADLEALEAGYLASEVSRGEHQAWHIPLWGCVLFGSVGFAAIYFLVAFLL
jgi:hypothetical protein